MLFINVELSFRLETKVLRKKKYLNDEEQRRLVTLEKLISYYDNDKY